MPTPSAAPGLDPAALAAAYDAGASVEDCAEQSGVSYGTARTRLIAAGVELRRGGRPASTYAAIAAAYDAGATTEECGKQFGIGESAARYRLITAGVTFRPPGRRPASAKDKERRTRK